MKVREFLYTGDIIWVETILNHTVLGQSFFAWYIDPNVIKNTNNVKYPYRIGIKKL